MREQEKRGMENDLTWGDVFNVTNADWTSEKYMDCALQSST